MRIPVYVHDAFSTIIHSCAHFNNCLKRQKRIETSSETVRELKVSLEEEKHHRSMVENAKLKVSRSD
jgi:hypothetical protein